MNELTGPNERNETPSRASEFNAPGRSAASPRATESTAPLSYGKGQISPIQGGQIVSVTEDEWVTEGFWAEVLSSNVAAIAYHLTEQHLFVEFLNGSVYRYTDCPEQVARAMYRASSAGKFVHLRLRGRYPYARIR